jgi:hypothetical protein
MYCSAGNHVTVFAVLDNAATPLHPTTLSFTIDGKSQGIFHQGPASGSEPLQYHVPVLSATGLTTGEHELVIKNEPRNEGSQFILDYIT